MAIDASVWISVLSEDEPNHEISRQWLERLTRVDSPLVTPTLALAEVGGAIARRTRTADGGRAAVAWVRGFSGLRIFHPDAHLMAEAAEVAVTYRLRGADAVYAAVARFLGVPLFTWDEELQTRAAGFIRALPPGRL